MDEDLAGLIRRRRIELGLSQAEAAKRAGVSKYTWNRWETRKFSPSPEHMEALCRALRCERQEVSSLLAKDRVRQDAERQRRDAAHVLQTSQVGHLVVEYWSDGSVRIRAA